MKLALRKRILALAEKHLELAERQTAERDSDRQAAALLQSACYAFMIVETDKGIRLMKKMMKASGMNFGGAITTPEELFADVTSAPFEDNGVFGRRNDVDQLAEIGDSVAAIRSLIRVGMSGQAKTFADLMNDKYGNTFSIALGDELRIDLGTGATDEHR